MVSAEMRNRLALFSVAMAGLTMVLEYGNLVIDLTDLGQLKQPQYNTSVRIRVGIHWIR